MVKRKSPGRPWAPVRAETAEAKRLALFLRELIEDSGQALDELAGPMKYSKSTLALNVSGRVPERRFVEALVEHTVPPSLRGRRLAEAQGLWHAARTPGPQPPTQPPATAPMEDELVTVPRRLLLLQDRLNEEARRASALQEARDQAQLQAIFLLTMVGELERRNAELETERDQLADASPPQPDELAQAQSRLARSEEQRHSAEVQLEQARAGQRAAARLAARAMARVRSLADALRAKDAMLSRMRAADASSETWRTEHAADALKRDIDSALRTSSDALADRAAFLTQEAEELSAAPPLPALMAATVASGDHITICFAPADRSWANWIRDRLESHGWPVTMLSWALPTGVPLGAALGDVLVADGRLLFVLSEHYLRLGGHSAVAWNAALRSVAKARAEDLVAVSIAQDPLPDTTGFRNVVKLGHARNLKAERRLLDLLGTPPSRPQSAEVKVSHMPKRNVGIIDVTVPHSARIWNFWLGGTDNYKADRVVGDAYEQAYPQISAIAQASREVLVRAVRHGAGLGVRQFLDIGVGLPTQVNTHDIAQRILPEARVIYVDNDPLVLAHSRALLVSAPEGHVACLDADLTEPRPLLDQAAEHLDLDWPVMLLLSEIVGHLPDHEEARATVRTLTSRLAPGSLMLISHRTSEDTPVAALKAQEDYNTSGAMPYVLRSREEISGFFDGMALLDPGLVRADRWRPDGSTQSIAGAALTGLAKVP
ncbi:SAM-dependent methyltransferase [Streptomyces mayteni]